MPSLAAVAGQPRACYAGRMTPQMTACAHCQAPIPLAMALHSAGYCERCEYMTREQVMRMLVVSRNTLSYWQNHRILVPSSSGTLARYHRADVEAQKARLEQRKSSWVALCRAGIGGQVRR